MTTRSFWVSLVSVLVLLLAGCSGLTIGPTVEKRLIVVKAGAPLQVTDQVNVHGRLLTADEKSDIIEVDIGGWVVMHPDHWEAVKRTVENARLNPKKPDSGEVR